MTLQERIQANLLYLSSRLEKFSELSNQDRADVLSDAGELSDELKVLVSRLENQVDWDALD